MLNEKNIQACFQYNASTGNWVFEKVDGSLLIDVDSPRVRGQVGSDKIAIDLGYSVDGKVNDWKFTIDGIGMLAIKTVAMRNDLIRLPIEKNECAIVTNDPNFRTILWLNSENDRKKLNYSFTTLNSSVSCWRLDEMGKKLNSYDPTALDNRIKDTENRITNAEGRLDTAETNITELQTGLSEEITARETADTTEANLRENADNSLNTRLITIEEKTEGFTRNTIEAKTMFTDSIVGTNDLLITGEARFAGPLSVANGQTDVQDFKVNGVVNGELKDSQGFKYIKIKTGKINNLGRFKNMTIEMKEDSCFINGDYLRPVDDKIPSLKLLTLTEEVPIVIRKINKLQFIYNSKNCLFATTTEIKDETSFYINFRNITDIEQGTQDSAFTFKIECILDLSNPNIIWD